VWAAPGRDRTTLRSFFDQLGPDRSAAITHVSADQADWITEVVAERCPHAVECADPFHIVKWATEALDEVRRQAWNEARRAGQTQGHGYGNRVATGDARRLKYARYALWKNPDNLTDRQRDKAGLDRQDRSPPAPRLPAQRRPQVRLRRQRRGR